MKISTSFALAGMTMALAACNPPDPNRTTSVPRGVSNPTALTAPITTASAPAAPAERGPIPANANAQAPGTSASGAFAQESATTATGLSPSKGAAPSAQDRVVNEQQAAAQAPDTASADAAKKEAMPGTVTSGSPTARDTAANNPRTGNLTPQEESAQMPKAGQANNHSSPALEKDSGRPSDGTAAPK